MRQSPIQPSNSFVPMPLSTLESRDERGWHWRASTRFVPKIVAGAHDSAERAETSVEAVVDPSAVLLEGVGVHLGESAGAAEAAAQHAVHGGASIRPARLDPADGLAHSTHGIPPLRTSSTPSRRQRRRPSLDETPLEAPQNEMRAGNRTHGAEAEVLVDVATGVASLVHGVRHAAAVRRASRIRAPLRFAGPQDMPRGGKNRHADCAPYLASAPAPSRQ